MPDLRLSQDTLDFESVQTGLCRVVTVQLHNHKQVRRPGTPQVGQSGSLSASHASKEFCVLHTTAK